MADPVALQLTTLCIAQILLRMEEGSSTKQDADSLRNILVRANDLLVRANTTMHHQQVRIAFLERALSGLPPQ